MSALVLPSGDQSQSTGEHIGGKELHAPLNDRRVWRNGRGERSYD